ncbi:hypothetical protein GIB67_037201 [Kingdonia uniflora]|uniref:KIB1-4 beta-propeller domain-containing protein n=1 Tax=Kingdonia uniflora TaxID=39325 RepID=A0A7J7MSF7_9MAGN|nr:hypothetical protein GIB67_037201 [Kingdonia uniflora]
MTSNWSDLPNDLLDELSKHFTIMNDLVRFGAVCVNWHSYFTLNRNRPLPCKRPRQPPVLMISGQKLQSRYYHLYSSDGVVETHNIPMTVPHHKFLYASTHGWLVIGDFHDLSVHLLNPFLSVNNRIDLPLLTAMDNCYLVDFYPMKRSYVHAYINKAALSVNPTYTSNYVLMIIYGFGSQLAFFRPGDNAWTPIGKKGAFFDIVYFKDEFYAVTQDGEVFACDIHHPHPKLRRVAPPSPKDRTTDIYLVESLGELLQVKRLFHFSAEPQLTTVRFKVFKLVLDPPIRHVKYKVGKGKYKQKLIKPTQNMYWVEMKTLHGQAVFVGENSTFSLSSSHFPGCKANCIYFTDDSQGYLFGDPPLDLGMFNVEEMTLEEHPVMNLSKGMFPRPIWVEPTLLGATIN